MLIVLLWLGTFSVIQSRRLLCAFFFFLVYHWFHYFLLLCIFYWIAYLMHQIFAFFYIFVFILLKIHWVLVKIIIPKTWNDAIDVHDFENCSCIGIRHILKFYSFSAKSFSLTYRSTFTMIFFLCITFLIQTIGIFFCFVLF